MNSIERKQDFWSRERLSQVVALLLVAGICTIIFRFQEQIEALGSYGYLGAFLISIVTSSTIVVPFPGWVVIAALGTVLNPFLVGVVSGVGGTIGETTGYMLGYGGRLAIENVSLYKRMVREMQRWGSAVVLVLALIPNPIFDIAGAAAGALRFPLWKFFLFGALGRIPKHILFALVGAWGWDFFFR